MAKSKAPPKKTKAHSNSHLNSNNMDKVKIKRVKRNKKEISTKEKILAGVGLGSTLLGGASMVSPQNKPTQFVRTQTNESNKKTNVVKDTLKKIFGIQSAKAAITYESVTSAMQAVDSARSALASAEASKENADRHLSEVQAWADSERLAAEGYGTEEEKQSRLADIDAEVQSAQEAVESAGMAVADAQIALADAQSAYESVRDEYEAQQQGTGGEENTGGGEVITPTEGDTKTENGITYTYYEGNWVINNGQTKVENGISYGSEGNTWILLDGQSKTEGELRYISSGGQWILQESGGGQEVNEQSGVVTNLGLDVWVNETTGDKIAYVDGFGNVTLKSDGTLINGNGEVINSSNSEYVNIISSFGSPNSTQPILGTEVIQGGVVGETIGSTKIIDGVLSIAISYNNGSLIWAPVSVASNVTSQTGEQGAWKEGDVIIGGITYHFAVLNGAVYDSSGKMVFDGVNLTADAPAGLTLENINSAIVAINSAAVQPVSAIVGNTTQIVQNFINNAGMLTLADYQALPVDAQLAVQNYYNSNPASTTVPASFSGDSFLAFGLGLGGQTSTIINGKTYNLVYGVWTQVADPATGSINLTPGTITRTASGSNQPYTYTVGTSGGIVVTVSGATQNFTDKNSVLARVNQINAIQETRQLTQSEKDELEALLDVYYNYSQITGVPTASVTTNLGSPLNADGSLKSGWIRTGDMVYYSTTTGMYSDASGRFQYTTLNQFNDVLKASFLNGFTYKADPTLPAGFNPLQYASKETAEALAKALGLPITAVSLTKVEGPVAPYPQYVITFPNGVVLNAGLIAQTYLNNSPYIANDMIQAEIARGGGTYKFAGANFGAGVESNVTATNLPADAGGSYVSPTIVQQQYTTTVTQPGVNTPTTNGGILNIGVPTSTTADNLVFITNVATFDTQGKSTNGTVSYGYSIEIGGVGLTSYSSFSLLINGSTYQVTKSVISENKITLTMPASLPTNIPTGAQVKVILNSTKANVMSGPLSQVLVFKNSATTNTDSGSSATTLNHVDIFNTGEIVDIETQNVTVMVSQNSVTLRAGTTATVTYTIQKEGIIGYGATITSSNSAVATAMITSSGIITVTGVGNGLATLVLHPSGVQGTQFDKVIIVIVTSGSATVTGTGTTGTGTGSAIESGSGGSSTSGTSTGTNTGGSSGANSSTGGSSATTDALSTIQRLNDQISQLQNQINSLNSRLANQPSGSTVINNTDTAQINSLRQQISDLQTQINRMSSLPQQGVILGNSNNQPFQGLQMPAGYSSSGGLQYQAPAEVKGAEVSATYTVKKGDNLWNIAKKYYGDGKQWRKILSANPNCLSIPGNTKTLKIGAILVIPQ